MGRMIVAVALLAAACANDTADPAALECAAASTEERLPYWYDRDHLRCGADTLEATHSPCGETIAVRTDLNGGFACLGRPTAALEGDACGGSCLDGGDPVCRPAVVVGSGDDCRAWILDTCGLEFFDPPDHALRVCDPRCGLVDGLAWSPRLRPGLRGCGGDR